MRSLNPVINLKHLFLFFLVPVSGQLAAQNYTFKSYGIQEGICHPFVYTINQDKNGFLWLGTGEGLCKFDGFDFYSVSPNDSVRSVVVNISHRDQNNNLWFGHSNGLISVYDGEDFRIVEVQDEIKSAITGITGLNDKQMLIATQNDGILIIEGNKEKGRLTNNLTGKLLTGIEVYNDHLLIGSQEGLMICSLPDESLSIDQIHQPGELEYIKINDIRQASDGNGCWIVADDEGIYSLKLTSGNYKLVRTGEELLNDNENILNIFEDNRSNLWLSTRMNGVICWHKDIQSGNYTDIIRYNKENGLGFNFVRQVFEDREGNIWISTYGAGLAQLLDQAFVFYNYTAESTGNNMLSVTGNDNFVWLGGETGMLKTSFTNGTVNESYGTGSGLPDDAVTALFYDEANDVVWIGTENSGVYKQDVETGRIRAYFRAGNSLGNAVNSISGDGENIYMATKDGIYIINTKENKRYHYTTNDGLPHNNIHQVFLDSENRLLFATHSSTLYEINEIGEVNEYLPTGEIELEFTSLAQDNNSNIWAASYGEGIFCFTGDSVRKITTNNGLKSNYCYSIIFDGRNSIWVGHRLGISRVDIKDFSVKEYDVDLGITGDCNYNSVFMDNTGILYFGTTDGLIRYNHYKDKSDSIPPKTNITGVIISDRSYLPDSEIILPYDAYKLRIEYIGLNYRNPDKVKYQYKLEGYDLDWSEITDLDYVVYPRVEDGDYTFRVRSFNEEGMAEETPAEFRLRVKLPFWKTWWFISLSVLFLIVLIFTIIKVRERKQKQLQEYLERKLDERTREVVEQKEEIEIKNRDITDSINYAQRIQASILPSIKKLHKNFSGSFVFYQPRDIVSGDFYWFDNVSENKFVIVCADSTGHGVPGAFMSMIGTTLIKDIAIRGDVQSPSAILQRLDMELRTTLNQNVEEERSNDGMDIIVCEIDTRTNYMRFASAMRPMIVYRNGEQMYIKGSRSSVGGHYEKEDKDFKDAGLQLSKGDILYMFSDGYPDQFGGPMGKKFKMVRLKNLLADINQKPMEEQFSFVKSTFNLWKEDNEQVDDVLFMGIKL